MIDTPDPTRRTVLKVAGGLATVTFLAGCGNGGGQAMPDADVDAVAPAVKKAIESGSVPVKGAAFLDKVGVVVTQPVKGEYRVFSNVCPHQNGKVTAVDEKTGSIVCVLHGSLFDPSTGAVVDGPSQAGLRPIDVPTT